MDEDGKAIAKRLLSFTLEIIYLLTGEDYTIVKKTSGDCMTPGSQESGGRSRRRSPITDPPPHSRIHERSKKKILEVTNKMIELLTGEVPIRCQDVTVYFSMEEWEYLEGHKDLYEDVMMEDDRPRTSQDGSRGKNPRPLYPQDHPEENHNVPEKQCENLIDIKVAVIDEDEETEDDPQYGLIGRNPPERRPNPPCYQERAEENHNVPENHQGEDLTIIKVEFKAEEEKMSGDPPRVSNVEEDVPVDVTPENPSKIHEETNMLSLDYRVEDQDIMQRSSAGNRITLNLHPGLHSTDPSYNPPHYEEPSPDQSQIGRIHTVDRPYPCSKCGKCFIVKSHLVTHAKTHTGVKPFSCSECGNFFTTKSNLVAHQRIHTGEKPYSCSECKKCFVSKSHLVTHQKIHTGEKPYTCSECGKCFTEKAHLASHGRVHTGEKPYSCPECGKCFKDRTSLVNHERSHTGEKPYSCSLCGKCFKDKSNFVRHKRTHTGEKPYSCPECGKCFTGKPNLIIHERIHRGEKPYSCSQCGKCFTDKSSVIKHQKSHIREKTF